MAGDADESNLPLELAPDAGESSAVGEWELFEEPRLAGDEEATGKAMSSVLAKAWMFVRSAWFSLLRTRTLRDTDDDASRRGAQVHEGGKGTEREGVDDGGPSKQVEVDGSRQPTGGATVAVADPGGADPSLEAEEVPEGPGEQASAEPEESGGVEWGAEEQDRVKKEPIEQAEAVEPEGPSATGKPEKPRKPRGPRRKPSDIGGARGSRGERGSTRAEGEERQRAPHVTRARIVCRKTAGMWELVVVPGPEVVVRGDAEGRAARSKGEFGPSEFRSTALIEDAEGKIERIPLYADEPMVFRLGKDWQGDGRKVGGVGVGHFVVIVPTDWTRRGDAPVEPEPCVDDGFRAHYFYRGREDRGAVEGFAEHGVSSSVIELAGERLFDTSEQGELFVGRPPALKAPGMAWARIGEEGTQGWAETFRLDSGWSLEDVLEGREGWFFVRVYREGMGAETDSVQFRYLSDLREIRVAGEPYADDTLLLPGARGHRTADVEVVCVEKSEVVVRHASSGGRDLEVQGSVVVCPADPELKEMRCTVEGRRGGVDIVVGLPRVWWGLASAGQAPQPWRDTIQTVTRQEFRRLAFARTEMRIDVPAGLRRVGVGFGDEGRIDHPARKEGTRSGCVVPLAHYLDHSQIARRLFRDAELAGHFAGLEVGMVRVAAEPPPRIVVFSVAPDRVFPGDMAVARWEVEDCEGVGVSLAPGVGAVDAAGSCEIQVDGSTVVRLTLMAPGMEEVVEERVIEVEAPQSTDVEQPVAQALTVGGWRAAKGFSKGELRAVRGTEQLTLRLDRRRRSVHPVNVASLERWANEQR